MPAINLKFRHHAEVIRSREGCRVCCWARLRAHVNWPLTSKNDVKSGLSEWHGGREERERGSREQNKASTGCLQA